MALVKGRQDKESIQISNWSNGYKKLKQDILVQKSSQNQHNVTLPVCYAKTE